MADTPRSVVRRLVHEKEAAEWAVFAVTHARNSVSEVAAELGVPRMTLYNWRRKKRIPVQGLKNYVLECERVLGIPRWFSRPDIYGWPAREEVRTSIGIFVTSPEQV